MTSLTYLLNTWAIWATGFKHVLALRDEMLPVDYDHVHKKEKNQLDARNQPMRTFGKYSGECRKRSLRTAGVPLSKHSRWGSEDTLDMDLKIEHSYRA
jgi:hypothetical protein